MLRLGPYPPDLKRRILSRTGHLSNEDCAALAAFLADSGTRSFLLGHISEENNSPCEALAAVTCSLAKYGDVRVEVAKPDCETVII
jgi:phosphoribosyl 1,2-cyclic phosphodiesterase